MKKTKQLSNGEHVHSRYEMVLPLGALGRFDDGLEALIEEPSPVEEASQRSTSLDDEPHRPPSRNPQVFVKIFESPKGKLIRPSGIYFKRWALLPRKGNALIYNDVTELLASWCVSNGWGSETLSRDGRHYEFFSRKAPLNRLNASQAGILVTHFEQGVSVSAIAVEGCAPTRIERMFYSAIYSALLVFTIFALLFLVTLTTVQTIGSQDYVMIPFSVSFVLLTLTAIRSDVGRHWFRQGVCREEDAQHCAEKLDAFLDDIEAQGIVVQRLKDFGDRPSSAPILGEASAKPSESPASFLDEIDPTWSPFEPYPEALNYPHPLHILYRSVQRGDYRGIVRYVDAHRLSDTFPVSLDSIRLSRDWLVDKSFHASGERLIVTRTNAGSRKMGDPGLYSVLVRSEDHGLWIYNLVLEETLLEEDRPLLTALFALMLLLSVLCVPVLVEASDLQSREVSVFGPLLGCCLIALVAIFVAKLRFKRRLKMSKPALGEFLAEMGSWDRAVRDAVETALGAASHDLQNATNTNTMAKKVSNWAGFSHSASTAIILNYAPSMIENNESSGGE